MINAEKESWRDTVEVDTENEKANVRDYKRM